MSLESWRAPSVEKREGGVEGVGLFTTQAIPEDQLLALKGGRLVTEKTIKEHSEVVNGSHVQVTPNLFLAGLTPDEVDKTLIGYNHSCEPNAYIDGQIALRSMKPLEGGEEVTVDYATSFSSDTQVFVCHCGSPDCRGIIQPSLDSQDLLLRRKFNGYFADFLADTDTYEGVELSPIDPNVPATSWLTNKAKRIQSTIHGIGLTTEEPVREGELLAVCGGQIISADEAIRRQDELFGTEVQIAEGLFLGGFSEKERVATLIGCNHSCAPNSLFRKQIGIVALADIPEGTELTVDYATAYISPTQRFDCNCGSSHCRGKVDTISDWKDPEIQDRFEGNFADFVQRKIEQAAAA